MGTSNQSKATSRAGSKPPARFEVKEDRFLYAGEYLLGEWDGGVFVPSTSLLEAPVSAHRSAFEFVRKHDLQRVPVEVMQWLEQHYATRLPVYSPGKYEAFTSSKMACCWGTPAEGLPVGDYKAGVCQPASAGKDDALVVFFDFTKAA